MRKQNAVFANFVCHFGSDAVLLDYAREIVVPALTDPALKRTYGPDTVYVIRDAELVRFGEPQSPVVAVGGRFIKNTVLRRHQVLHPEQGLIPDQQAMASAPSAWFLLVLNNHRLVYLPETPYAPDLVAFEAAARKFISERHKAYIDGLLAAAKERGERTTKAALMREHGRPVIDVVPLSNEASIEAFLKRFSKLQRIEFELVKPNQEIDGSAIWRQWREQNQKLAPDKTVVRTEKSEGFDLQEAGRQIADAAASGGQRVRLVGRDENDNKIDGDNDSFKVSAPIKDPPKERRALFGRLYQSFVGLMAAGTIRVEQPADDVQAKLRALDGM
ncbi:hypothetical protein [Falsiroseomonas sp. CW058]|uniref:hypothetical protein n=1 Tax=Falsiroseomonas sp. CW058 TaxID=3388664 RepID=UPI003D31A890